MKKGFALILICGLAACAYQGKNTVALTPPTDTKAGFVQVLEEKDYYLDSSSIWIDNAKPEIIHFDMVTNLSKGQQGFKDNPAEISRSVRSHKNLNCKTYTYSRAGEVLYSQFWGDGIALRQYGQLNKTEDIVDGSNLDTVAKVLCANFYREG